MTLRSMQSALMLFGLLSPFAAYGEADKAQPVVQIMPGDIKWTALPPAPGVELTWLHGGADKPGLYELRVRMTQGSVVPLHTHPDTRYLTVLSGELYVGLDSTFEPDKTKKFPAGSFLIVPAGTPHYVIAKNGDVVFQESGIAPSGTDWIKR